MELVRTPFIQEVRKIFSEGPKPVHYSWRLTVIVNNKKFDAMKVTSVVLRREYDNQYGDEIMVEVMFDAATFYKVVVPNRENLQVVIFREPLFETNAKLDLTKDIDAQPLRATLLNDQNLEMEYNRSQITSDRELNLMNIVTVKMALVDPALEKLRMMTFEGIYRNTTTWELIRHILTVASREVTDDENFRIRGVDVYTPSNQEKKRNIIIPNGMRLTDVPYYLHQNVAGVYNSGFGYFLQRKKWWVYPLFDLDRFKSSEKGLTLIKIPFLQLPETDRTYRILPNPLVPRQIIALVTEDTRAVDDGEYIELNYGNGIRFADADQMFEKFAVTKDNKTVIERKKNINEYLVEPRSTKLNNVQRSPRPITSNTFFEASRMARRKGMFLSGQWDRSDPGLIWPGMPVRYLFMKNDKVFECYGVVQALEHYWRLAQPGFTVRRHICTTAFKLFLSRPVEKKD